MSEIRKDLVRDNWVVIATERMVKPTNLPVPSMGKTLKNEGFCPFCPGNEKFTPPELIAIRPDGSSANEPGWVVRGVPNKFSAYSMDTPLQETTEDIYIKKSGFGFHEVIVETPQHDLELHDQDPEGIAAVLNVLKERTRQIAGDDRFKYIQIYKNKGLFAGASIGHSHCQIISLPYVPDEFKGAVSYATETGGCLFCAMMKVESEKKERLVYETDNFMVICPYAPRFVYETWILPRKHQENFAELEDSQALELAQIIRKVLRAMVDLLNDPSYNLVINTAPVNVPHRAGYHWFVEINPRIIVQSGVENATGYFMNPVSPEWSAETLSVKLAE